MQCVLLNRGTEIQKASKEQSIPRTERERKLIAKEKGATESAAN